MRASRAAGSRHWVVRALDSGGAYRFVQLAVVLTLVIGMVSAWKQRVLAECLAGYNDRVSQIQAVQRDAAEKDRAALDELVFAIQASWSMPREQGRPTMRAAFDKYVANRTFTNQQRLNNPPPPPPAESCRNVIL